MFALRRLTNHLETRAASSGAQDRRCGRDATGNRRDPAAILVIVSSSSSIFVICIHRRINVDIRAGFDRRYRLIMRCPRRRKSRWSKSDNPPRAVGYLVDWRVTRSSDEYMRWLTSYGPFPATLLRHTQSVSHCAKNVAFYFL